MAVPGQQKQICPRLPHGLVPEAYHCEEGPAKQSDPAEAGLSVGFRRLPTSASREPILVFWHLVDATCSSSIPRQPLRRGTAATAAHRGFGCGAVPQPQLCRGTAATAAHCGFGCEAVPQPRLCRGTAATAAHCGFGCEGVPQPRLRRAAASSNSSSISNNS